MHVITAVLNIRGCYHWILEISTWYFFSVIQDVLLIILQLKNGLKSLRAPIAFGIFPYVFVCRKLPKYVKICQKLKIGFWQLLTYQRHLGSIFDQFPTVFSHMSKNVKICQKTVEMCHDMSRCNDLLCNLKYACDLQPFDQMPQNFAHHYKIVQSSLEKKYQLNFQKIATPSL